METFGERLRRFRESLNLSQDVFGQKVHVTQKAVSRWETDNVFPQMDRLCEIADVLEVGVDDLLYDDNDYIAELIVDYTDDFQRSLKIMRVFADTDVVVHAAMMLAEEDLRKHDGKMTRRLSLTERELHEYLSWKKQSKHVPDTVFWNKISHSDYLFVLRMNHYFVTAVISYVVVMNPNLGDDELSYKVALSLVSSKYFGFPDTLLPEVV